MKPEEADQLLAATAKGELLLDNLRGRSCYDAVTQAGEYFLRQQTGQVHMAAYNWQQTNLLEAGRWRVSFLSERNQIHQVTLAQDAAEERLVSCHPSKTKVVTHYRFEEHQVV